MIENDQCFDPTLKKAAAEIKKTLLKYEVSGFVQLFSPTHAEYLRHFSDWTGIFSTKGGDEDIVHLRISSAELGKSGAKQRAQNMAHVLSSLSLLSGENFLLAEKLLKEIEKAGFEIVPKTD